MYEGIAFPDIRLKFAMPQVSLFKACLGSTLSLSKTDYRSTALDRKLAGYIHCCSSIIRLLRKSQTGEMSTGSATCG
jgi:hypothetical protein